MKLIHPEIYNPIEFDESQIQILSIEDKDYFSNLVEELCIQSNGGSGRFILSENNEEVNIGEDVVILQTPFLMDFNDKRLYKVLYKELEKVAMGEEQYLYTQSVISDINRWIYSLSDVSGYDLDIPEYDITTLIKGSGVKFSEEAGSLAERFIDYVRLFNEVLKTKLFVLINFKSFFSDAVIDEIYKTISLKKINVLLFENTLYDTLLPKEKVLIIDEDLCEIIK